MDVTVEKGERFNLRHETPGDRVRDSGARKGPRGTLVFQNFSRPPEGEELGVSDRNGTRVMGHR